MPPNYVAVHARKHVANVINNIVERSCLCVCSCVCVYVCVHLVCEGRRIYFVQYLIIKDIIISWNLLATLI